MEYSFKQLREFAQELNYTLGLNPPIEYIRTTKEQLLQEVLDAGKLLSEGDVVKESVLNFLYEMHVVIGKSPVDYVIIKDKPKTKKSSIFDCFGKDYDRKSKICEDCDRRDFCRREYRKSLELLKQLKEGKAIQSVDMLDYKYTQYHALIDALKIGGSKKEIIEMASELYMKKMGEDKKIKIKSLFNTCIPALLLTKSVRKHGDFYLLRKY